MNPSTEPQSRTPQGALPSPGSSKQSTLEPRVWNGGGWESGKNVSSSLELRRLCHKRCLIASIVAVLLLVVVLAVSIPLASRNGAHSRKMDSQTGSESGRADSSEETEETDPVTTLSTGTMSNPSTVSSPSTVAINPSKTETTSPPPVTTVPTTAGVPTLPMPPALTFQVSRVTRGQAATMTCRAERLGTWLQLSIRHTSVDQSSRVLVTVEAAAKLSASLLEVNPYPSSIPPNPTTPSPSPGSTGTVVTTSAPRVSVSLEEAPSSLQVEVTLNATECSDMGGYVCEVTTEEEVLSTMATLVLSALPQLPQLRLPRGLVVGRPLGRVTCSGSVGFPGGMLTLALRAPDQDVFSELDFQDGLSYSVRREACDNMAEAGWEVREDVANGTEVRCQARNTFVQEDGAPQSTTSTLLILPDGACEGRPLGSLLAYPGDCTLYLHCGDKGVTVESCPGGECFQADVGRCVSTTHSQHADAEVHMQTEAGAVGEENSTLTCTAWGSLGEHYNVTLAFSPDDTLYVDLLTVTSAGYAVRFFEEQRMKLHSNLTSSSATVTLVASPAHCRDAGFYKCRLQLPTALLTDKHELKVKAVPGPVELTLPLELVAERQALTRVQCRARVGYPDGQLTWLVQPEGQAAQEVSMGSQVIEQEECYHVITKAFFYTPVMSGNGTLLICRASNNNYPDHATQSSAVIYVLTGRECEGQAPGSLLAHPQHCDRYVRCQQSGLQVLPCPQNHCFSQQTQACLPQDS